MSALEAETVVVENVRVAGSTTIRALSVLSGL
jgi:hypothetical protein